MKPTQSRTPAFTLIELLVVIAIIAVLAAVLYPAISQSIERGKTTKCQGYLRVLGAACVNYAAANDMTLPVTSHQRRQGGKSWSITLQPYAAGTLCFRCPCDENKTRAYSYLINDFLTPNPAGAPDLDFSKLSRLERQRETILFGEAHAKNLNTDHFHFSDYAGRKIPPQIVAGEIATERHESGANYLFADGHVEHLTWERVQVMLEDTGCRLIDPTAVDTANLTNP